MKTQLLTGLIKALVIWVIRNYNPYLNVAFLLICIHLFIRGYSDMLAEAYERMRDTFRQLTLSLHQGITFHGTNS